MCFYFAKLLVYFNKLLLYVVTKYWVLVYLYKLLVFLQQFCVLLQILGLYFLTNSLYGYTNNFLQFSDLGIFVFYKFLWCIFATHWYVYTNSLVNFYIFLMFNIVVIFIQILITYKNQAFTSTVPNTNKHNHISHFNLEVVVVVVTDSNLPHLLLSKHNLWFSWKTLRNVTQSEWVSGNLAK